MSRYGGFQFSNIGSGLQNNNNGAMNLLKEKSLEN
jgi:hypothetical protein